MVFGALNNAMVGSHTRAEWDALVRHYGHRCHYCAAPICANSPDPRLELTKDHLSPLSRMGVDFIWNIVPACWRCNRMKGNKTAEEFLADRKAFGTTVDVPAKFYTANTFIRTQDGSRRVDSASPRISDASNFAQQIAANLCAKTALDPRDNSYWEDRRSFLRRQVNEIARLRLIEAGQLTLPIFGDNSPRKTMESEAQTLAFKGMEIPESRKA